MQWVRDIAQSSYMMHSQPQRLLLYSIVDFSTVCMAKQGRHALHFNEMLTKAYIESVVHRAFEIMAMLPKIQYVHNAIKGIYKSGALTSCLGGLNGCPPAICTHKVVCLWGTGCAQHSLCAMFTCSLVRVYVQRFRKGTSSIRSLFRTAAPYTRSW